MRRFALVLLIGMLVAGCSRMRTVRVPAQQPTINATTDTVRLSEFPPAPARGVETQPGERAIIDDTASTEALRVQRWEIDNRPGSKEVRFFWERGDETIKDVMDFPVHGEMLVGRPGSVETRGQAAPAAASDTGQATDSVFVPVEPIWEVVGGPKDKEVTADVRSVESPWYQKVWVWTKILIGFAAGSLTGYAVGRLFPFL